MEEKKKGLKFVLSESKIIDLSKPSTFNLNLGVPDKEEKPKVKKKKTGKNHYRMQLRRMRRLID